MEMVVDFVIEEGNLKLDGGDQDRVRVQSSGAVVCCFVVSMEPRW